jgi:hypothetical protein
VHVQSYQRPFAGIIFHQPGLELQLSIAATVMLITVRVDEKKKAPQEPFSIWRLRHWAAVSTFLFSPVAGGPAAFAAGFFGFFAAPLVGYTLLVGSTSALLGNLALAFRAHGGKTASCFLSFLVSHVHTSLVL